MTWGEYSSVQLEGDRLIERNTTVCFLNQSSSFSAHFGEKHGQAMSEGPPSSRNSVPLADQAERRDYETPMMLG